MKNFTELSTICFTGQFAPVFKIALLCPDSPVSPGIWVYLLLCQCCDICLCCPHPALCLGGP